MHNFTLYYQPGGLYTLTHTHEHTHTHTHTQTHTHILSTLKHKHKQTLIRGRICKFKSKVNKCQGSEAARF